MFEHNRQYSPQRLFNPHVNQAKSAWLYRLRKDSRSPPSEGAWGFSCWVKGSGVESLP